MGSRRWENEEVRRLWLLVPLLPLALLWRERDAVRRALTAREPLVVEEARSRARPPRVPAPSRDPAPVAATSYDNPELDRLIAICEAEEYRDEKRLEERGAARNRLGELVALDAVEIVAGAIRVMMTTDRKAHRRAQLLLAVAPPDAVWGLERLLDAPDALVRAYAQVRLRPSEPQLLDDPRLYRQGTGFEPVPVQAIRDHVFVPKKDRKWKEEFESDYEHEYLPLLREIDKHLPAQRRILADLDGDGEDEMLLDGTHVWNTRWRGVERFLAVVESDGSLSWVQKFEERTERVVVCDADGDGTPEIFCWIRQPTFAQHLLGIRATGAGHLSNDHHWYDIGVVEGPLFYSSSHYIESDAGTWGIDIGVLARKVELHRWKKGFWDAGSLYLPVMRP